MNKNKLLLISLIIFIVLLVSINDKGPESKIIINKVEPESKIINNEKEYESTINRKIRIIIQECCRGDLIELQYKLFKKFMLDEFELYVVLSNDLSKSSNDIGRSIIDKSKDIGFNISYCTENSLDSCYDYSYKNLISNFDGYVMFANSDMFLWRHFSINTYMRNTKCPIAAIYEVHEGIYHLHPGLHIIDPSHIPEVSEISWKKIGSDVGGATRFWISKHPDICVHPMLWSRDSDLKTLANLRLIPLDLFELLNNYEGNLRSDLYLEDFSILHPRGGSNWQRDSPDVFNKKFEAHFNFLQSRLNDIPLRWSPVGSTAIVNVDVSKVSSPNVKLIPNGIVPINRYTNLEHFISEESKFKYDNDTWLSLLFEETDRIKEDIKIKKTLIKGDKLPLPRKSQPRTNLDLNPARYDKNFYQKSTVYYWKYIYNESIIDSGPDFTINCKKEPGQKYWVATWGSGQKRETLGRTKTIPSCKSNLGIDEAIFWTTSDLDPEYVNRNSELLKQERGNGLWMWKHYTIYMMLQRMNDNDILFYLDSDMMCSDDTIFFFCLANKHDITPFHHNHQWYTLSRLARRDAMIFMDLDYSKVAESVQYSGGNIFVKKTPYSVKFIREMAAWSQQPEVIMGWKLPSEYGVDWPEYLQSNMMHQCDQAISSLMHIKYGHKSYPWRLEGFGGGSDDPANIAERREAGIPFDAKLIIDLNS